MNRKEKNCTVFGLLLCCHDDGDCRSLRLAKSPHQGPPSAKGVSDTRTLEERFGVGARLSGFVDHRIHLQTAAAVGESSGSGQLSYSVRAQLRNWTGA